MADRINWWSVRARRVFSHYGLGENPTPRDVVEKLTVVDLLKRPNCGRLTVQRIAAVCRDNGLTLRTRIDHG